MGTENKVELSVPHVQQTRSWDCGLACSQMALKYLHKDISDFQDVTKSLGFGESVWTIDLANIMKQYQVKSHLCTITLGVDKGYASKTFYKDVFSKDELRVNNMFENAAQMGLSVEEKSVTTDEMIEHLSKGNVIICLIDWNYLRCKWCDRMKCLPISCVGKLSGGYQGHYIIVCGYNKEAKHIYFHNPSFKEELCCSSIKTFDKARKSYGTDEDTLFIYSDNTENAESSISK